MDVKRKVFILGLIFTMFMLTFSLKTMFVIADDTTSDTENTENNDWNVQDATGENWGVTNEYTGTRYTIKVGSEEEHFYLKAGTKINGSNKIKGYETVGMEELDECGPEFDLPEGNLVLERSDWVALAKAKVNDEFASNIEDTSTAFMGFVEQYLYCGCPECGYSYKNRMATEMQYLLDNDASTSGNVSFIKAPIEASFKAFSEESPELYSIMGFTSAQGWGGYSYEAETVDPPAETPVDPPPETPVDPPPGDPEDPGTPPPTVIPGNPYTIVPILKPAKTSYSAEAIIDDTDDVSYIGDVSAGDPIPTSEKLVVRGKTNLGGVVEGLELYEVQYDPEHEYSYTVNWEVQVEEIIGYAEYTFVSGEEVITTYVLDSEGNKIPIYGYVTYDSGSETVTKTISGSNSEFIKVTSATKATVTDSATVNNATLPSVTLDVDLEAQYIYTRPTGVSATDNTTRVAGDDKKIIDREIYKISKDSTEDPATVAMIEQQVALLEAQNFMNTATYENFWNVKSDSLTFHSNTGNVVAVKNNGTIELTEYYNFAESAPITISTSVANNSTGAGYPSSCYHTLIGATITSPATAGVGGDGYPFGANSVRVHTPIYNKLTITSTSTNQLKNTALATGTIVTLGDSFTVNVNTSGGTTYYGTINTAKYINSIKINCAVCGNAINSNTHNCTVPLDKEDNKNYTITATVIAENGAGTVATSTTNAPDAIGTIKQNGSVYAAGKIYDMQVRTTDDTGWKLSSAQGLAQLPIGEYGDNANKVYKYAIKLGYKAFFDFKTLGIANKGAELKPKMYYVDTNGNVDNDVEFYFKTSPTKYEKLGIADVLLKMTLNSTKGETNNEDFVKEKALTTQASGGKDFSKVLNIGKLGKIIKLTVENALNTVSGVGNERRWYGEVYMPASLVVAPVGTSLVNVSNGKGVMKSGYVIVTFEDVTTKLASGDEYLQYSVARDANGADLDFAYSKMYQEKATGGTFKNTIQLSNGKTFDGYAETEIPIIVYDISMRANNDYESQGTH